MASSFRTQKLLAPPAFAIAAVLATLALVFVGQLVSATDSGLACPDWPLCEGELIPPMKDGKQFEHSHRLVALFVAAMTFGLWALTWKHRRADRLLVRLTAVASGLVVVQALLGALTVWLSLPAWTSSTHQAVAMAFLALLISIAHLLRQRDPSTAPLSAAEARGGAGARAAEGGGEGGNEGAAEAGARRRLGGWTLAVGGLLYFQLVVGAVMRHTRGGLACGMEWPACFGGFWPLGHLGLQSHLVHRWLGVVVGLAMLALAARLFSIRERRVRALSVALGVGVLLQVLLGVLTVTLSRHLHVMTSHTVLGVLLWAGMVSLYWRVRPVPPLKATEPAAAPSSAPDTSWETATI